MRVICMVPEYPPDLPAHGVGGITTYFLNMSLGYSSNGAEVVILTSAHDTDIGSRSRGPNGETVERVFGHRSRYSPGHLGRLIYELQREIRLAWAAWRWRRGAVLVEIPDWQTPLLLGMVVRAPKKYMKLHGPADFVRIINAKSSPRLARLVDFREKYWARRVDLLESGSPVLVKHVKDNWGLARSVPVTPDPIAGSETNSIEPHVRPAFLGDPDDDCVRIVNVGRLEFRKGQHVVCRSLAQLGETQKSWKLHFVGPDTSTAPDGSSYRDFCESLVPADLRSRVTWEPPVPLEDLPDMYRAADVVLISTLDGNYGYTTLQPLASGSCVVTTFEPGETESQYAVHGETALLYPSEDPDELADVLKQVVDDPTLRDRLRRGARARAESTLSPSKHVRSVFESIGVTAVSSDD